MSASTPLRANNNEIVIVGVAGTLWWQAYDGFWLECMTKRAQSGGNPASTLSWWAVMQGNAPNSAR